MVQSPLLGGKHGRRTEYSGDGDNYAELKSVTASTSGHMPAAKDEPVTCVANTFNFVGAVANLANAAVGAGVLAFPFAFRETGLVLGPLMAAFFGLTMGFTLHVLASVAAVYDSHSYQEAARQSLGVGAERVAETSMYLYLFGSCIAYLNIIGDQIQPLMALALGADSFFAHRTVVIVVIAVVIVLPLCMLPSIEYLSFTSMLAVASILYMEIVVIVRAFRHGSEDAAGVEWFIWGTGIFQAVPIICFALQCHLVCVPAYQSLYNKSLGKMDIVSMLCIIVCLILYVPTGEAGYYMLVNDTPGDILTRLPTNALDVNIGRICIAMTSICSYPLLQLVSRTVVEDLLFRGRPKSRVRMLCEVAAFMIPTLAISLAVPHIKTVLGLTGSTTAVMQVFVLPGFMWMRIRKGIWSRIVGWTCVVFGVGIGVVSTIVILMSIPK